MEVLEALMEYDGSNGKELAHHMGLDASNVTPRLNELRTEYNAVHKGPVRLCSITNNPCETWWCGPEDGTELTARKKDKKLTIDERVELFYKECPQINTTEKIPTVAVILGVSETRLKTALKKLWKKKGNTDGGPAHVES